MALGDGIRRDIALVSENERNRFIDAIVKLDTTKFFPDGVSYWDKQEEIHKNAHFAGVDVHGGPAFIPWHRVIVNRLEQLLREVDPDLSLHYWDWTTDPRVGGGGRAALFTPAFMGNASGDAGHLLDDFESTEDAELGNGHDKIWRDVGGTAANPDGTPALNPDATILAGTDFDSFGTLLKQAHDSIAHSYIGGTISDPHYSFHDPFVFLLHSNLDRLWAKWQTEPGQSARMVPGTAYAGLSPGEITLLATEFVEPWAGGTGLEPWASDPSIQAVITYMDTSVVTPPCYDTNGSDFQVLEAENPFNAVTSRFQINFNDVPEEETTWRAAVIRLYTCGEATIRVKPGAEPAAPFNDVISSVTVNHGPVPYTDVRLWFEFTAGALGTAPQTIAAVNTTIECVGGPEFEFELIANTIERETVAVQMALDQSGSMAWEAGTTGTTRLEVLQDAAKLFAELIQPGNGIGIIRFDHDAYPPDHATYPGMAMTTVVSTSFSDDARLDALAAISAHGAHGDTSVGDGLLMARAQLTALPVDAYDNQAILLLTDGIENEPEWIENVIVDDRTYAVGLGNEAQVNTQALTAVAGSTGGYLLLSGLLSASIDDQFRLRKFFLQILANVTKTDIVEDPVGYLNVGMRVRIPFRLSEADINCRVILLTDFPVIRLSVETPDGQLIDEGNAASFAVAFDTASTVRTARFNLPVPLASGTAHAGTWHAVLEIDEDVYHKLLSTESDRNKNRLALADLRTKGARYCLTVHSFSNLRMTAAIDQSGFLPGSTLSLRARLTEYGQPVERRAEVRAELEYPDHTHGVLALAETAPGVFDTSLTASQAGIYKFRVRAEGGTYRGAAFTREQLLTAAVFHETRNPGQDGGPEGGGGPLAEVFEKCCRRMGIFVWIIIFLLILIIMLLLRR